MTDRYIFIREYEDEDGNIQEVRHTFTEITHDKIADHFNDFLRGCGFIFDINERYMLVDESQDLVSLTPAGEDFLSDYDLETEGEDFVSDYDLETEGSGHSEYYYETDRNKPINNSWNSWPFANYGGEKCSKCGMTREQMGQQVCWEPTGCGLGLNPTINTNHE